jgi:hypothetical protein
LVVGMWRRRRNDVYTTNLREAVPGCPKEGYAPN